MKTIKPQKLGLLTKPFENGNECFCAFSLLAFVPLGGPAALLPEVALWKFVGTQLGAEAVLDLGMPKANGELLVTGRAYTRDARSQIACAVRAKLGSVDKALHVVGDRRWSFGVASAPEPFTEMPLSYTRAFGGAGYALNPLGRGFAPASEDGREVHRLPNVEHAERRVQSPADRPAPAGFGPYDFAWPQRASKAGTYDARWLRERFPGYAEDMDWTIFNAAPDDQQVTGFFKGDERYTLTNMHPARPSLEGRLPGLATRLFVTQRDPAGAGTVHEVVTRLDTVWLFPDAERGVLIYRGLLRVAEDDAADVVSVLAACESQTAPRTAEYYRAALRERLDKTRGALLALRDRDLLPESLDGTPLPPMSSAELDPDLPPRDNLLAKNLRRAAEREREKARATLVAAGLDPDVHGPPPVPPEEPEPDLENLSAVVERADAMAEQGRVDSAAQREKAEAQTRALCAAHGLNYEQIMADPEGNGGGPPRFSAHDEIAKLQAFAATVRASGGDASPLEAMAADPVFVARLVSGEQQLRAAYVAHAHLFPPAARAGGTAAIRARAALLEDHAAGVSLAGRDLTGAFLAGVSLRGADLRGALMERADLTGADLADADLTGAVLARADLTGADCSRARLLGANCGSATLRGTKFVDAQLVKAVLAKADVRDAVFAGADLTGADLSEAQTGATNFRGVTAPGLVLLRTDLTGAVLADANLTKASFIECTVADVDFTGARLSSAVFLTARGDGAVFRAATLDNLRFVAGCSFARADFRGANLAGANLRGTRLAESIFAECDLTGADLSECDLRGATLHRATAREARLVRADLTNAVLTGVDLMHGILQKATIDATDFTGANLFRADLARVRGKATGLANAYLVQTRVVLR